jgi:hypothetical protein
MQSSVSRVLKYSGVIIVLLLLSSPVLYAANEYRLKEKYERALARIRVGDSRQRVVALMGEPDEREWCYPLPTASDTPELKRFHERCVEQYRYSTFMKPYYISFDKDSRVSGKGYTISP